MANYRPRRSTLKELLAFKKLPKEKQLRELEKRKVYAQAALTEMYKYFHGVRHENASSEIKYSQIKVLEGYIQTLAKEIESLKNSKR